MAIKPEVRKITTVVPSTNASINVDLPAGAYRIALIVTSAVTGTTTTIGVNARNAAGAIVTVLFRGYEPNDSAPIVVLPLPAGTSVQYFSLVGHAGAAPADLPILLSHGLTIAIVKGTAVTGEALDIELIAQRVE